MSYTCKYCGKTGLVGQTKTHEMFCNPEQQIARFWASVDKRGPEECWPWTAQLRWDGYGRFVIQRKPVWTHRYSWELHNGEKVPAGKEVMHICDNPSCVNPAHLKLGTHKENMADMHRKGRQRESIDLAKAMK